MPLDIIKDAIVVPTEAIIPVQNGKKVFISNNGQAKEVMVETATRTDASILILSGLKAGDTVINQWSYVFKKRNTCQSESKIDFRYQIINSNLKFLNQQSKI